MFLKVFKYYTDIFSFPPPTVPGDGAFSFVSDFIVGTFSFRSNTNTGPALVGFEFGTKLSKLLSFVFISCLRQDSRPRVN